jgi:curved DNA-binding protein CbpA
MHRTLASRDHFEALGVSRTASAQDVRQAFERQARRFHPDAQAVPELAGLGRELAEIFARLAEAERVLKVPPKRAEYERRLVLTDVQELLRVESAPPPAPAVPELDPAAQAIQHEEAIAAADRALTKSRYWDALQAMDALLPELQGRQRRRAAILRARALAQNPKWRKDAEDQLKAILTEDPASVDALFELGRLYKTGGLDSRAAAAFRRVLELRPRHSGALAELGS